MRREVGPTTAFSIPPLLTGAALLALVMGGVWVFPTFAATPRSGARAALRQQLVAITQPDDARRLAPFTRPVYPAGREVLSEVYGSRWSAARLHAHFDRAFRDQGWRATVQPSLAGVLAMHGDQDAPETFCRPGYWARFTPLNTLADGQQRYLLSLATLRSTEACT